MTGQQFEYAFDDLGNRKSTKAGGDQNGSGLRNASYAADYLSRYTSRSATGVVDVIGVTFSTNTVRVNDATASLKGKYFWNQACPRRST